MNETSAPAGSATTVDEIPDIDIWSWTKEKDPALESLREIKLAVLLHEPLRREVDRHLEELGPEPGDVQAAGLARWMLAEYRRAWELLSGIKKPCAAVSFARAEACLRSYIKVGDARPMRRPDLAVKELEKHPALKTDLVVYERYLEALAFDEDMEPVKPALDAAPAAFKKTAAFRYFKGRIAEFEGDYKTAQEEYDAALAIDPEHRATLLRLAYQYDLGGDDELAIDLYRRLASLKPLDVHALINYGVMLEDRERHQEAIACYQAILKQDPNHRRALAYLRDAQGSLNMVFDEDVERRHDKRNRLLRIPINDFELSVRARNCLANMKIETLGDLVQKTESELLAYKNFGDTSLTEIKSLLDSKGLRLGMNLEEDPIPLHPSEEAEPEGKETRQVDLPPGVDPAVLNIVLADMELSVRVRKALSQLKIVTLGDLLQHSEAELLALKNFGTTSLNELKSKLAEYGVTLRSS